MPVMKYHLKCPWCGSGETLADARAKTTLSIMCPKCRKAYLIDLDTLETTRSSPQKRLTRRK